MRILAIETSCDETAVAVLEAEGGLDDPKFKVLSHNLYSQASKHAEFGGVYPNLAKREHGRNLVPLLKKTLEETGFGNTKYETLNPKQIPNSKLEKIKELLERNPELSKQTLEFLPTVETPDIDAIAVTEGPGLEPALWVGINFAKALGLAWEKPVVGVNHMEGHICSVLVDREITKSQAPNNKQISNSNDQNTKLDFPAVALLISGGHTELILIKDWVEYEMLGQTRDDAVGEAYDKSARVLGLPYPGGPQISILSKEAREKNLKLDEKLPRPMLDTDNMDFSFSGLKTAVLYYEKKHGPLSEDSKKKVAREIDEAVTEVLIVKTKKALEKTGAKTLIIAGGVIANPYIRKSFAEMIASEFPEVNLLIPTVEYSTDNAVMIGIASYIKTMKKGLRNESPAASGALRLEF